MGSQAGRLTQADCCAGTACPLHMGHQDAHLAGAGHLACKACCLGVDGRERIPTLKVCRLNDGSVFTPARSELGGATLPSRGGCPCPRERLLRRVASPSGCTASCTQAQRVFSRWVLGPELVIDLPRRCLWAEAHDLQPVQHPACRHNSVEQCAGRCWAQSLSVTPKEGVSGRVTSPLDCAASCRQACEGTSRALVPGHASLLRPGLSCLFSCMDTGLSTAMTDAASIASTWCCFQ